MKGFILGVAVGGATVALWSYLQAHDEPLPAEPPIVGSQPQSAPLAESPIEAIPEPKCMVAAQPQQAARPQVEATESAERTIAGVQLDPYERQWGMTDALKRQADALSERQSQALCSYIHRSNAAREEAKFRGEAKDESWAPPMEQLITQHVNGYLKGLALDELKVDCRTTFCDISARGAVQNGTQDKFGAATRSINDQPWSDFSGFKGQGGGSDGSRWHANARVMRASAEQARMLREVREAQERQRQGR